MYLDKDTGTPRNSEAAGIKESEGVTTAKGAHSFSLG